MAYIIPTPADVRAAYPAFGAVGDGPIQNALDLGGLVIDETWPEPAYALAFKLYAAHALRLDGLGTFTEGASAEQGGSNVKRRKAGDHEIEFFGPDAGASSGSAAWYEQTGYGRHFRILQRRYFGGPRVY